MRHWGPRPKKKRINDILVGNNNYWQLHGEANEHIEV